MDGSIETVVRRMVRLGIAPLLLGTVIVLAWMLNRGVDIWFIRIGRQLAAYEGFHILMHLLIFGCETVLMGSGEIDSRRWMMWGTVIVGAVGIEIAQVWATGFDQIDGKIIWAAVFDLIVDSIGVMVGLMIREWTIPKSNLA